MKKIILILLVMFTFACKDNADDDKKDPNHNDKYPLLSKEEEVMIDEMNEARKDPPAYAEKYIKPLLDKALANPKVDQGYKEAVQTAYNQLKNTSPLKALTVEAGLVFAARDHGQDPLRDKAHHSTRGAKFLNSLPIANFYSKKGTGGSNEIVWDYVIKNCLNPYGTSSLVLGWIVDNGNKPDYGHRNAIMSKDVYKVGVAIVKKTDPNSAKLDDTESNKYAAIGTFSGAQYETKDEAKKDYNYIPTEIKSQTHWNISHKPLTCPLS